MPASRDAQERLLALINDRTEQLRDEITEETLRPLVRKLVQEALREELGRDVRRAIGRPYRPDMEMKEYGR